MIPFVHRRPELLAIEGIYDNIIVSCRHKDIFNCSKTRHFRSCFSSDGINSHVPYVYCYSPNVCVIGKKDKSGQWLSRAFGFYKINYCQYDVPVMFVSRIYGNELDKMSIGNTLKNLGMIVRFLDSTVYPSDPVLESFCSGNATS